MQKGMTRKFVYSHAYIAPYHTFASQMDNVLLPDGSVNPYQTFFSGTTKNYKSRGEHILVGAVAQIAISLPDAYEVTHQKDFLNKATDLLDPYALPANPLGMWIQSTEATTSPVNFKGTFLQPISEDFL